jgi:membrane protein
MPRPSRRSKWRLRHPAELLGLLKKTVSKWNDDPTQRFGAALAYYTAIAVVPMSIITLELATYLLSQKTAEGLLLGQVEGLIGQQGAEAVGGMIKNWLETGSWIGPTLAACAVLFIAAAGAFDQLQDALNTIWGVEPKPQPGYILKLRQRFLSLLSLLGTAFLLVVSLAVNAIIAGITSPVTNFKVLSGLIGFVVITFLFAMIFKLLPKAKIAWSDVWIGALVTTGLFTLGKWIVITYLAHSTVVASYGAPGSFVMLLLWALYSSHVLLFGAEFTAEYASEYGSRILPTDDAVAVGEPAKSDERNPGRVKQA